MSRMKLLLTTPLWRSALDLTDAAGEAFCADVAGWKAEILDELLAEVLRVASCVTLGLEEKSREVRVEHLETARKRLGVLAARVHVAESRGVVARDLALGMRTKLRVVADELDLERYRCRRRAG